MVCLRVGLGCVKATATVACLVLKMRGAWGGFVRWRDWEGCLGRDRVCVLLAVFR